MIAVVDSLCLQYLNIGILTLVPLNLLIMFLFMRSVRKDVTEIK